MNILFLDIETISGGESYDMLSPAMQHLRDKKASHRQKDSDLSSAELYEKKAGIFSEFGKIVCIVCWYESQSDNTFFIKSFAWDDEKKLIWEFLDMINQLSSYILCGHNAKEFDIPYICRRATLYGLSLPKVLDTRGAKPREVNHKDTMEIRSFGDRKNFTSLALLCELFGIQTPKNDIDWSQVSQVYRKEKNLTRIVEYCKKDVVATAQVYHKLMGKSLPHWIIQEK